MVLIASARLGSYRCHFWLPMDELQETARCAPPWQRSSAEPGMNLLRMRPRVCTITSLMVVADHDARGDDEHHGAGHGDESESNCFGRDPGYRLCGMNARACDRRDEDHGSEDGQGSK